MSTFVENPVTGGNPPGFDLGEPNIVTDSYKYYGSSLTDSRRNKIYRNGNGITLYTDRRILECRWKSNEQIEIGSPIFLLTSTPEEDFYHFVYINSLDPNPITKDNQKYVVTSTHTSYPAFRDDNVPSEYYIFTAGRLYRRSNDVYYIIRTGFFGNLTSDTTAVGIQFDDEYLKFGIFNWTQLHLESGYILNKDTFVEKTVGAPEHTHLDIVFSKTYEAIKIRRMRNFRKLSFQGGPGLTREQIERRKKPKIIAKEEIDTWSDDEDTKLAREYATKYTKNLVNY